MTEDNDVRRSVYSSIDSELKTLRNEIREERGETIASDTETEDTTDTSTTYPVPEEEDRTTWRHRSVGADDGRVPGGTAPTRRSVWTTRPCAVCSNCSGRTSMPISA